MKPKKDQTTDGKGGDDSEKGLLDKIKSLFKDDSDADADLDGSDTPADDDGGQDDADDDDAAGDAAAEGDDTPDDAADTPDDEDVDDSPLPGDDGEKKFTQTEANKFVTKRLAAQKKSLTEKFEKEKKQFASRIGQLEKQLNGYLNGDRESVKAEFEALPEAIRETAPGNLDSTKGVAAIKKWLPKAKKLAETVSTGSKGNKPDFKPLKPGSRESDEETLKQAKKHSIYSSF
jgi:hypothetical protein